MYGVSGDRSWLCAGPARSSSRTTVRISTMTLLPPELRARDRLEVDACPARVEDMEQRADRAVRLGRDAHQAAAIDHERLAAPGGGRDGGAVDGGHPDVRQCLVHVSE